MKFKLPQLPYNYDAMEPFIDKETMEIHYTKHHQNYINQANYYIEGLSSIINEPIETIIKNLDLLPLDKKTALRNNLGGHFNHSLFWKSLKPGSKLSLDFKKVIEYNFGSVDNFKYLFEQVAISVFGSGWAWLIKQKNKLAIVATANQDNPQMGNLICGISGSSLLGLDLWEHAYYLKYRNCRIDYIKSFWQLVNWEEVAIRFYQN